MQHAHVSFVQSQTVPFVTADVVAVAVVVIVVVVIGVVVIGVVVVIVDVAVVEIKDGSEIKQKKPIKSLFIIDVSKIKLS